MIYSGSFVALSFATTSSKDGPVNLRVVNAEDPPGGGGDEEEGPPTASTNDWAVCTLNGREEEPGALSDEFVSSLRREGKMEEDMRYGLADWGLSGGSGLETDFGLEIKGVINALFAMFSETVSVHVLHFTTGVSSFM